jgi:16S rRNA (adenine1518-N6/adenine1519-N6)-dimethyltransferase
VKVKPKKRLGQNFLKDRKYLTRIVSSAEINRDDLVLEIGAGEGDLTQILLERASRVIAVEIDDDLIPLLRERLSGFENLHLIHGDALRLDWVGLVKGITPHGKAKLVANIPYYITTPLIEKAIESRSVLSLCVMTVQSEVARRICASPGGKDYGSLSVMVQYHADVELLFEIPPGAFRPSPEVRSSVIRLLFRGKPRVVVRNEDLFFRIVRASFQQRRKMIRNSLRSLGVPEAKLAEALKRARIPGENRAERLSIEEFGRLADELDKEMEGTDD